MAMITWERMLIRMGFVVEKTGEKTFSFVHENEDNIHFFKKILNHLNIEGSLFELEFKPKENEINEEEFLTAYETIQGGDIYFKGVANVELAVLDTYISGLIRWLNSVGFRTTICCDGHDRRPALIGFKNRELEPLLLNSCLNLITKNEWGCSPRGNLTVKEKEGNRVRMVKSSRYRLLDLAELIYENRTVIKEFVHAGLVLGGVNITNDHYKITQRAAKIGERIQLKKKRLKPRVYTRF
ncbi:hypothetical protein [Alkalihalobacillus sp. BA299]|uniref:hypothetical protein n=1 Tax=Alkalihalobacillus sp. BA299 TaxID=2815938 RepID=UPI001ADCA8EB|nr:hypothetical protein [Alkalihalobacillus sp. BA299]